MKKWKNILKTRSICANFDDFHGYISISRIWVASSVIVYDGYEITDKSIGGPKIGGSYII